MRIQYALSLAMITLFVLMTAGQVGTLWWLQQQLQQQLTSQSGELSKMVLARTASKIKLLTDNQSSEGRQLVFETEQGGARTVQVFTTQTSQSAANLTDEALEKSKQEPSNIHLIEVQTKTNVPLPQFLQQELDQILGELNQTKPNQTHWIQQFNVERQDRTAQLLQQYLSYQVLAWALTIALALALTLWLGYRFIAPLKLLVSGFQRLAKGESQVQLNSHSSLMEYRYVLDQFNQASQQLDELESHRTQLAQQQQLVELGEISRGLVHALRNPIHTMALALEQLPSPTVEQQKLQQLVEQKMQHINRTLTALLTLSCEGIDRQQAVSLPRVLQDIALEFSSANVQLELNIPAELQLYGAETELRSIFHAVISNAIEASPEGATVQVMLTGSKDAAQLQVQDQGAGIAPEIITQLFQPHISTKAEGAGMGLYLCRRLLQRYYHGDVTLTSGEPHGCIAQLQLHSATRTHECI